MKKVQFAGVTLIELLIALGIISLILAVAIPSYQKHLYAARRHEAIADILKLQLLEERYRYYNTSYGTQDNIEDTYGDGDNLPVKSKINRLHLQH